MNFIRRVIPLYIHIAYLFLGLLLTFAMLTLGHQYQQTKNMLMKEAEERFTLIGQMTTNELAGLFFPATLSVNMLAQQRLTTANTLAERMANIPYMVTLLRGESAVNEVYAGYNNGDVFQLLRWSADLKVPHLVPPTTTRWLVKNISFQGANTLTDIFALTDDLAIVEHKQIKGRTFDVRTRPWFIQAKQAEGVIQTPPYISIDTQEINLSVAKPMQNGAGIVGVDLSLRSIEYLLKSAMLTPNMRLAIVNAQGELITSHKGGMIIHGEQGTYRLANVTEAHLPMIKHLMDASTTLNSDQLSFQSDNRDWQGMRVSLHTSDASHLSLWIAAPVDELLSTAISIRNQTFLLSGIFLLLALFAAIALARTAARPLDSLTREARKIARFDFNEPVRVSSYIAEIIDLSQAMGDMKSTIQRFLQLSMSLSSETSFPRLLVRLLTEMQQLTGATGCMLYLFDSGNETLELAGLCWHGEVQEHRPTHCIGPNNQPTHTLFQSLLGVELEPVKLVSSELQILFPYLDASDIPLTFWPIALTNRDGQLLGTLVFLIDEHEKKLTHQRMAFVRALSSTAAVALAAQRLLEESKIKSDYLAVMSHEIRTPLNAIIGGLELSLKKYTHDGVWSHDAINAAYSSSLHLSSLIGNILDIAKIEAGGLVLQPCPIHINEFLASQLNAFYSLAKQKDITLALHPLLSPHSYYLADENSLKQIIYNLLGNAIKFTQKGRVSISAYIAENNFIRFEIRDTGCGISLEQQATLFTPYFQADIHHNKDKKGTGLGLAICKQLSNLMGGDIVINSSLGNGTLVSVTIPMIECSDGDYENTINSHETNKLSPTLRSLNILIVDDHSANLWILTQQLHFLGHQTLIAEQGEDAYTIYNDSNIDVIITDCNMPVMNGYELTKKIRQLEMENNIKPIPIIGFTANAQMEERQACLAVGMTSCLFKPVDIKELSECLAQIFCDKDDIQYTVLNLGQLNSLVSGKLENKIKLLTELLKNNAVDINNLTQRLSIEQEKESIHRILGVARILRANQLISLCEEYSKGERTVLENILFLLEILQGELVMEYEKATNNSWDGNNG
ncbi:ATP-binding protein [Aeromonas veronii]|uniref:ATP-binding protein n=1 Tax=Aeromonas veronii TaxID=654 RepID=UPI00111B5AF7|nr:ATP-binding protein [Aeromonas veronii]TNI15049.1 hypothetical protein CF106_01620 [Aeromonas veronii]